MGFTAFVELGDAQVCCRSSQHGKRTVNITAGYVTGTINDVCVCLRSGM